MENAKITTNLDNIDEKDAQNLDICFLLDCTGSMQPYIDLARDKIKDTIKEVKSQYPDSDIRISIVGYRDVRDKDRFLTNRALESKIFPKGLHELIFEFSESVDEARSFLEGIKADGGHDVPEDMNGGFRNVLYTLKWKYFTRMLYHITDAPCHGRAYHSELDNFPKGHPEDIDWKVIFSDLITMNINYVFMKIHNRTDKMVGEFKKIYKACPKSDIDLIFNEEVIVIQQQQPQQNVFVKPESPETRIYDMPMAYGSSLSTSSTATKSVSSSYMAMEKASFDDFCYEKEDAYESKSKKPSMKMAAPSKDRWVEQVSSHAMNQIASNIGYLKKKAK